MSVHRGGAWSGGVPGPGGVSAPGGCLVPGRGVGIPACTEADPPGETATAADGTHPTGLHSCLHLCLFQGLFGLSELRDETGFYLLQKQVFDEADTLVKEATSPNRDRKLVQIFDQLSDCLCRVADLVCICI